MPPSLHQNKQKTNEFADKYTYRMLNALWLENADNRISSQEFQNLKL